MNGLGCHNVCLLVYKSNTVLVRLTIFLVLAWCQEHHKLKSVLRITVGLSEQPELIFQVFRQNFDVVRSFVFLVLPFVVILPLLVILVTNFSLICSSRLRNKENRVLENQEYWLSLEIPFQVASLDCFKWRDIIFLTFIWSPLNRFSWPCSFSFLSSLMWNIGENASYKESP